MHHVCYIDLIIHLISSVQGSTGHTQSPARSQKEKKSKIPQDWDDDDLRDWKDDDLLGDSDDELYVRNSQTHNSQSNHSGKPICNTIEKSINNGYHYSLDILLRELKLRRNRPKHRSTRNDRSKMRHPHTILTHVIHRGDPQSIQVVLEHLFTGDLYRTMIEHVCYNGRTALWYACSKGNLKLVQQLVERGRANVNRCGVLIVAAQNGHETIVNYLLSKNCDPNRRTRNYNERAIHAASRRNHLGIVKALLKYGADPTILDYKQRTALDYAIHKRHNEIVDVLIKHQNGYLSMSQNGYTPLMLAASRNNISIVDMLMKILPHQQVQDELALLACNYIIYGVSKKRDEAYCYFERALSMMNTSIHSGVPCEAYEFMNDCETLDELAVIRKNDNAMRMYALVVGERLLLKYGEVNHLVSLIIKQSNIYRWTDEFHRCLQLRLRAYELVIQTENSRNHHPKLYKKCLNTIISILFKILEEKKTPFVKSLVLVWKWTLNIPKKIFAKFLFKFICIATHLIESKSVSNNEQYILLDLVQRTLHRKFIIAHGCYIFSYCIIRIASDPDHCFKLSSISVPVLSLIRLLIRCGADVNEIHPDTKSTPLHLIIHSYDMDVMNTVIRLLLDANAHTDYTDRDGRTPELSTWSPEIKELLRNNRKLSLKCRCANVINLQNVPYENYLSSNLITFVQMHSRYAAYVRNRPIRMRKRRQQYHRAAFRRNYRSRY